MEYLDIMHKVHINAGSHYKNLSALKHDLIRTEACNDSQFVGLAKQIFDANLPNNYKDMSEKLGMCYYWTKFYYKLYTSLGYNVAIRCICFSDSGIMPFTWVQVTSKFDDDVIVDISKIKCVISMKASKFEPTLLTTYLIEASSVGENCYAKEIDIDTLESLISKVEPTKYKLITLPSGVFDTIDIYIDQLINGDIAEYNFNPLANEFKGFKLMYLYVTDSHSAKSPKYLKEEIQTRLKYKRALYNV